MDGRHDGYAVRLRQTSADCRLLSGFELCWDPSRLGYQNAYLAKQEPRVSYISLSAQSVEPGPL